MPAMLRQWLDDLGQVLFPAKCLGCGRLFHPADGRGPAMDSGFGGETATGFPPAMARYFCRPCRGRWTLVRSPLCSRCGLVFAGREGEDHLCDRCLTRPGAFTRARAAGIHDQTLRNAVHALKFKRVVGLAGPMGALLWDAYQRYWTAGEIDLVAPVPLHRRRFRQRGFNQAYLLVRRWSMPDETVVVRDLLVRTRATPPQTGLDRRQRRLNIKDAFAVNRPGQSRGKRVLLVDDVLTTGATVDACAAVLLRDGAVQVDVLTLARAL